MRSALLFVVLLAGCRTRPIDTIDAVDAAAIDLAAPVDAARASDLAGVHCQAPCDPSTELCVFLNRGDCSQWTCAPRPLGCTNPPTCACLGGLCSGFAMPGETLTCQPPDPALGADVICASTIQCV
ncbi:MAG TPA: hypothetical protein VFF06_01940 [Polyangia bacterium]|nr:hypothetical protein [Polyangia bacterium]